MIARDARCAALRLRCACVCASCEARALLVRCTVPHYVRVHVHMRRLLTPAVRLRCVMQPFATCVTNVTRLLRLRRKCSLTLPRFRAALALTHWITLDAQSLERLRPLSLT